MGGMLLKARPTRLAGMARPSCVTHLNSTLSPEVVHGPRDHCKLVSSHNQGVLCGSKATRRVFHLGTYHGVGAVGRLLGSDVSGRVSVQGRGPRLDEALGNG